MLVETGNNAVAVGFTDEPISGFRPSSSQGAVQVRRLQSCLPAAIEQCSIIGVPHVRTPALWAKTGMLISIGCIFHPKSIHISCRTIGIQQASSQPENP